MACILGIDIEWWQAALGEGETKGDQRNQGNSRRLQQKGERHVQENLKPNHSRVIRLRDLQIALAQTETHKKQRQVDAHQMFRDGNRTKDLQDRRKHGKSESAENIDLIVS